MAGPATPDDRRGARRPIQLTTRGNDIPGPSDDHARRQCAASGSWARADPCGPAGGPTAYADAHAERQLSADPLPGAHAERQLSANPLPDTDTDPGRDTHGITRRPRGALDIGPGSQQLHRFGFGVEMNFAAESPESSHTALYGFTVTDCLGLGRGTLGSASTGAAARGRSVRRTSHPPRRHGRPSSAGPPPGRRDRRGSSSCP